MPAKTKRDNYMNSCKQSPILLCMSYLIFFLDTVRTDPYQFNCSVNYYTNHSRFEGNLDQLLSTLVSRASISGFYNYTAGENPDRVYGLFLCKGDLSSSDCQKCIETAQSDIKPFCPNSKQAILYYYENCQIRYSDQNFFGLLDTSGFNLVNSKKIKNPNGSLVFMTNLVKKTRNQPDMFASDAVAEKNMYGFAQCSRDLSPNLCEKCLNQSMEAIELCCSRRNGWRYIRAGCNIRYESYPFFNGSKPHIDLFEIRCPTVSDIGLFESNLREVLTALTMNAPRSAGFFNTNSGEFPDTAYGLALCRADIDVDYCQRCLQFARDEILANCRNTRQGVIWCDLCLVHYSNQNFFGSVDTDGFWMDNFVRLYESETKEVEMDSVGLLRHLVQIAPYRPLMIKADRFRISRSQMRYALLQCTRDLTVDKCSECLAIVMNKIVICCRGNNTWRYYGASCSIRYEAYPFFNTALLQRSLQQPTYHDAGRKKSLMAVIISSASAAIVTALLFGSFVYCFLCRRKSQQNNNTGILTSIENDVENQELPLIDFTTVQEATCSFSDANKLGEGGFGPVYKGLLNGKEVAVKRLSKTSEQGLLEFRNELILIAKLQHKNLVRLLCCCIEREEKLLVYEFMPNTSLDGFLFDPKKSIQLDWERRINIINGIARGLVYLHEDSRLRIIHRDLKASNILLDHEMNPKISDFGMARIFGGNQNQANTNRVVGTYGYMAPEYAMHGLFSTKSDVFSFGVLILEIISGKRNTSFNESEVAQSLLEYTWKLWCTEKVLELVDPFIAKLCPRNEALKCINIGLLCVQQDAADRPTMSSVVVMLASDSTTLPRPTKPAFFIAGREEINFQKSTTSGQGHSINVMSLSNIIPR